MGQKQSFEEWKKEAIEYLHTITAENPKSEQGEVNMWDFLLGDDEDMLPSYNDGESPEEYVDYQIECAS